MSTIILRASRGRPLTNDEVDSNFINLNQDKLEASAIGVTIQAYDADLNAIAALSGTSGVLKKTAANTWALDTSSYLTSNQTVTLTGDASGSGSTSISVTLSTVTANKGGTGRTSLNSNSLLVGNGTSPINFIAPGSSGNLLVSNGTSWISKGVSDNLYSGVFPIFGTSVTSAEIRLYEDTDNGNNYISLKSPLALSSNFTLTLPSSAGSKNQLLSTDDSGTLSWVDRPTRSKSFFYSSF